MPDLTRVAAARKRYDHAMAILDRELLRRADEVRCPLSRRDRREDAHRVSGEFFRALGDPQRAYPAIHVTGTSGKGSVVWGIARELRDAGLRVGMHLSPYLQVATEKVWIDGLYVDAADLDRMARKIEPAAARYLTADCPATVHGMASAAVAFEAFRRARVDVAVVEACCGGRWDVTAHLDTRVAVITSVGDDHADVLGPTVRDIARHKAGILRRGAAAITGASGSPLEVIRAEARDLGADLVVVPTRGRNVLASNRDLVEAAVRAWSERGGNVPGDRCARTAGGGRRSPPLPPGRLEVVQEEPRVVLDIAHNPQKLRALVRSMPPAGRRPVLVAGFIAGKSAAGMLRTLARTFRSVVFTEPHAFGKPSVPASRLADRFGCLFDRSAVEPDPRVAVAAAIDAAGRSGAVLVTGSAYVVGGVRGLWFPDDRVLVERTSYPAHSRGVP